MGLCQCAITAEDAIQLAEWKGKMVAEFVMLVEAAGMAPGTRRRLEESVETLMERMAFEELDPGSQMV